MQLNEAVYVRALSNTITKCNASRLLFHANKRLFENEIVYEQGNISGLRSITDECLQKIGVRTFSKG